MVLEINNKFLIVCYLIVIQDQDFFLVILVINLRLKNQEQVVRIILRNKMSGNNNLLK